MASERALVRYLLGLFALMVGAELAACAFEPQLAACADRVGFKLALLERHPPAERVLAGTSRFNDGLEGRTVRAFNASVPSSSLKIQQRLLEGALSKPGVTLVVLEISPEQQAQSPAEQPAAAAPLALLRQRRALAVENWPRLLALPFAASFDGSEWFRTRWANELWREQRGLGPLPELPRPTRRDGGTPAPVPASAAGAAEAWIQMAALARARGVVPVFVAPPVDDDRRANQCGGEFQALLDAVAAATQAVVLDYGCIEPPADFFISNAHLNARGRAWFSRSLKAELDALQ